MGNWFYTEHYLINSLRLLCYWVIGLLMGIFIQKNRVLERLKARLAKKEEKEGVDILDKNVDSDISRA